MKRIRYGKKDFSWVKWSPEDIYSTADRVIVESKEVYAAMKRVSPSARTFENTVYAIESAHHLSEEYFKLSLLMNVSPEARVREAAQQATERIEKASIDFEYDAGVYRALKEYAEIGEKLSPAKERLLLDLLRDFRRRGLDLSKQKQLQLKKNLKKLATFASTFNKNLNDYQDFIAIGKDELAGLPDDFIASLPRKNGKYIITLDRPLLIPFLENAKSESRRRELVEKQYRKGGAKNLALLQRMVALREENAKLLGYLTHGDFQTEDRMAKNSKRVFSFLRRLMRSLDRSTRDEVAMLIDIRASLAGESKRLSKGLLESYDVAYLANQLKKSRYDVDDEHIREYFPLPFVKKEVFSLFGTLFQISFERLPWKLWHKDAELYAVCDAASGERIAYFALDLFPRKGKYGHACVSNVISGHTSDCSGSKYVPPFATLITNFPKPSAARPSLLSHEDLITFLHEFGHLLHESLSQSHYVLQSPFSVSWDFVEAMSQMCEFFAWEEKTLKRLSSHYQTGKPLPPALIRKLQTSKQHMLASDTMRQAAQAWYDMLVHTGGAAGSLSSQYAKLIASHQRIAIPKSSLFPAGFGHLAGGYDAGYYGYLWSRVYAADFFTKFRKAGIIAPAVGAQYRKDVLAVGASKSETDIAESFLGRPVSEKAFFTDIGIKK